MRYEVTKKCTSFILTHIIRDSCDCIIFITGCFAQVKTWLFFPGVFQNLY